MKGVGGCANVELAWSISHSGILKGRHEFGSFVVTFRVALDTVEAVGLAPDWADAGAGEAAAQAEGSPKLGEESPDGPARSGQTVSRKPTVYGLGT